VGVYAAVVARAAEASPPSLRPRGARSSSKYATAEHRRRPYMRGRAVRRLGVPMATEFFGPPMPYSFLFRCAQVHRFAPPPIPAQSACGGVLRSLPASLGSVRSTPISPARLLPADPADRFSGGPSAATSWAPLGGRLRTTRTRRSSAPAARAPALVRASTIYGPPCKRPATSPWIQMAHSCGGPIRATSPRARSPAHALLVDAAATGAAPQWAWSSHQGGDSFAMPTPTRRRLIS
jgi:hypothetical protein